MNDRDRLAAWQRSVGRSGDLRPGVRRSMAAPAARPFNSTDLVLLERVSDPRISPDGHWVAYQLLETDLAANRSITQSLAPAPIPEAREPIANRASRAA